jgi:hypothetical protein
VEIFIFYMILPRTQKREMGLAMMLFCVVIVFFCCNILALVVNLLEVKERCLLRGHCLLLL